jgi:hypothetical protein
MDLLKASLWIVAIFVAICVISSLRTSADSKRAVMACDTLVRESSQLILASKQDKNPVFALLHSTEAVSFARALSFLGRDESLQRRYSVTAQEMLDRARNEQTNALRSLHSASPGLLPEDATAIAAGYVAPASEEDQP